MFSISPIFADFPATKTLKIPISLNKLKLKFINLARFNKKYPEMRYFRTFSNIVLKMTRLNLANVVISKIVHKRTFFLFVKLNDEREALGFFCLPPNLIYRKFLIRLGRMWNDSGLFSLIKNYRHLSFSVVMLTFWVIIGCGTGRENFSAM